jgi:hypothetical protein
MVALGIVVPLVFLIICTTAVYAQVAFIIVSTWIPCCSCFVLKENSEKSLLLWQIVCTGLGFISLNLSVFEFDSTISSSTCKWLVKSSTFFYLLSLFVLYFFYQRRLELVRMSMQKTVLEKSVFALTFVHLALAFIAVFLIDGELSFALGQLYCNELNSAVYQIPEIVLSLILNPAYWHLFSVPLKHFDKFAGSNVIQRHDYHDVLRRNYRATTISTFILCGTNLIRIFINILAARSERVEFNLLYLAGRGVRVVTFCSCMFVCTFAVWTLKARPTKSAAPSQETSEGQGVITRGVSFVPTPTPL